MKKIFLLFSITALLFFNQSCSKEVNGGNNLNPCNFQVPGNATVINANTNGANIDKQVFWICSGATLNHGNSDDNTYYLDSGAILKVANGNNLTLYLMGTARAEITDLDNATVHLDQNATLITPSADNVTVNKAPGGNFTTTTAGNNNEVNEICSEVNLDASALTNNC